MTFTEIAKGKKRSVNSQRKLLMIDEAQENLGLFYFFVHNHPSNLSIFPSRTDITDLARIRADYERGGIQIRPIKANIRFGPYRDRSSLDILLYQEREQRPMGFDETKIERAIEILDSTTDFDDIRRARLMGSYGAFNVALTNYTKNPVIDLGLPHTSFNSENAALFDQTIKWDSNWRRGGTN